AQFIVATASRASRRWCAKRPCQHRSVSRSCRQLVQVGETPDAVALAVTAVPPAIAPGTDKRRKSPEQRRTPMTIDRRTFVQTAAVMAAATHGPQAAPEQPTPRP